jgi:hypothetical protein
VPEISLSDLLYQWGSDANCNITACNQGYLEQAAANPQVQAAKEVLDLQCDGELVQSVHVCQPWCVCMLCCNLVSGAGVVGTRLIQHVACLCHH